MVAADVDALTNSNKRMLRSPQIDKMDGINDGGSDLTNEERAPLEKISASWVKKLLSMDDFRNFYFNELQGESLKTFRKRLKLTRKNKVRKLDARERLKLKQLRGANMLYKKYAKFVRTGDS
ncbi:unnamed protein product [Phytophthora lilii]|uniref:Unnamed protein product n=1 Tax=Phytophthora lilii TaxID=2077276 RepID=A0A9W6TZZ3_9STRA|nr:unnamed protein product [Phytophthora lilii]